MALTLSDDNCCGELSKSPKLAKLRKWAIIGTVLYFVHCGSTACSIRYGFLADSFTKRDVPGKLYGFTEGSMFFGFSGLFFFTITEWLLTRYRAKTMFVSIRFLVVSCTGATGLIYYLITNNNIFIPFSVFLRISQGAVGYAEMFLMTDFARAQFPSEFDRIMGLIYMGSYTGHGVAETLGCFLYDHFGYYVPFIYTTIVTLLTIFLCAIFIPNSKNYVTYGIDSKRVNDEDKGKNKNKRVTWLIAFPLIATLLINANYGYIQVTVTPYLSADFGKSISYSGVVLLFVSVGMAIGSVVSGITLQRKLFKTYTQMGIGAFLVAFGLFIIFPPPYIKFLYNNVPYLAFFGVFLAGFGDPFISIAALKAMIQTQESKGSGVTPKQFGFISGLWLMATAGFYYLGSMLAGILIDTMSFSDAALVLIGMGMVSILMCVISKFITTGDGIQNSGTDETTIIQNPLTENSKTFNCDICKTAI